MSHALRLLLLLVMLPGLVLAQSDSEMKKDDESGSTEAWKELKTTYHAIRGNDLKFILPTEHVGPIEGKTFETGTLKMPTSQDVTIWDERTKIGFDTNADNKADIWCKSPFNKVQLTLKNDKGKPLPYQMIVKYTTWGTSRRFSYYRGCYRKAKFKGTQIVLVDDTHDGNWNDYGKDAMVVGSTYGQFLSRVISVKGELYECEVAQNGTTIRLRPWSGETGKCDLSKMFKAPGKLVAGVISDDERSFNVVSGKGGMKVPVGTYKVRWGFVKAGSKTCHIKTDKEIEVESGKTAVYKWGAPFKLTFGMNRDGIKVELHPDSVSVIGSAEEEYFNFIPGPLTPKIKIRHGQTKQVIKTGSFSAG